MTINGGQPHAVGYRGQKYRIVADEEQDDGTTKVRRIGWSNDNTRALDAINTHPCWTNARYEEVEDPDQEGTEDSGD